MVIASLHIYLSSNILHVITVPRSAPFDMLHAPRRSMASEEIGMASAYQTTHTNPSLRIHNILSSSLQQRYYGWEMVMIWNPTLTGYMI